MVYKKLISTVLVALLCLAPVFAQNTVEQISGLLDQIKTYEYGTDRTKLSELDDALKTVLDSPESLAQVEQAMLVFLQKDATFAAKQFVCKKLSIIGTEKSVPGLVTLLADTKTANIALYALERIPGEKVDKALLKALKKANDDVKVAIINVLGQRDAESAVKVLKKNLKNDNKQIVSASLAALGKIASPAAAKALEGFVKKSDGDLQFKAVDAWLQCADADIYNKVYASDYPATLRVAALRGIVQTSGNDAVPVLVKALTAKEPAIQSAAAALVRDLPKDADLAPMLASVSGLNTAIKIQLVSALADRQDMAARPAVLELVSSDDELVRTAALSALARLGTARDIELLAATAATGSGKIRETARESLVLLRGDNIDQQIVSQIADADTKIKTELIMAAGGRNIAAAAPVLLSTAQDDDRMVRRESYKALGIVAAPSNLDRVIELVLDEENNTVRQEGIKTMVAIAHKINGDNGAPIRAAFANAETLDAKSALLQALGSLGDEKSLPIMQEMLQNPELELQKAAIRALSVWTDASPADDLMAIVTNSTNNTLKILALRGYLGLLKLESDRSKAETVALFKKGLEYATETNEKRLALSGLAQVPSQESLNLIASYLDNPTLKPEAEVAVMRVLMRFYNPDVETVKKIMNKIVANPSNERIKGFAVQYLENLDKN